MHQMIKQMSDWDDISVLIRGEVVMEQSTNKIKIGDAKTTFADLPYVESDIPKEPLSIGARAFIEDHIELIDNNDYETFYSLIKTTALAREISNALFKAGLNPKEYLKECPRGCESIFYYEGKDSPDMTIKNGGWADIINPHPNRGKTQYTWMTTAPNHWDKYSIGYDVDKEVKAIKKQIDYLHTWTLEDDE